MEKDSENEEKFQWKRYAVLAAVIIVVIALIIIAQLNKGDIVLYKDDQVENSILSLKANGNSIHSYSDGGTIYLFLPSYITSNYMRIDGELEKMYIDGKELKWMWKFQYNHEYLCHASDGMDEYDFTLVIMKSDNINTIFIDTESKSMVNIWEDKSYKEPATTAMYDNEGNLV